MDIEAKIDSLVAKIDRHQESTSEKLTTILTRQAVADERTAQNGQRLESLENEMKPLKRHAAIVGGMAKIAGSSAAVTAICKVLGFLVLTIVLFACTEAFSDDNSHNSESCPAPVLSIPRCSHSQCDLKPFCGPSTQDLTMVELAKKECARRPDGPCLWGIRRDPEGHYQVQCGPKLAK